MVKNNELRLFRSLDVTRNQSLNIGRSVEEIFKNLAQIGQMYTMDLSDDDFYKMESIHNVLNNVYDGNYPIYEIMSKVNGFMVCTTDTLPSVFFTLPRPRQ